MARKSLSAFDVQTAEFVMLAEYQHELARETYGKQDKETQKVIDKLVHLLRGYSTGSKFNTNAKLRVAEEHIEMALFVIAVEVVKDLALCDLRVANFVLPKDVCVKCGEEV